MSQTHYSTSYPKEVIDAALERFFEKAKLAMGVNNRIRDGRALALSGAIQPHGQNEHGWAGDMFTCQSQHGDGKYTLVLLQTGGAYCDCADHAARPTRACKHMIALSLTRIVRNELNFVPRSEQAQMVAELKEAYHVAA